MTRIIMLLSVACVSIAAPLTNAHAENWKVCMNTSTDTRSCLVQFADQLCPQGYDEGGVFTKSRACEMAHSSRACDDIKGGGC
jgi:hypothetical protein